MTLEIFEYLEAFLYVAVVMILSVGSTIQTSRRIKGLKQRESAIIEQVGRETDKITAARGIAINLLSTLPDSDGRMWFALYRVGQMQDPVGWAIRDVLLDPDLKNYQDGGLEPAPKDVSSSDTDGPGIS
jgi:hypothetical protein